MGFFRHRSMEKFICNAGRPLQINDPFNPAGENWQGIH
jgi:hypothetical protein